MSEHKMGGAPRYLSLADRVVGWVGHLLGQVLAPQLAGVIHSGLHHLPARLPVSQRLSPGEKGVW